jgi:hypothetical protein
VFRRRNACAAARQTDHKFEMTPKYRNDGSTLRFSTGLILQE